MIDLGTLGGTCGNPTALNNKGQVVGFSNLNGDQFSDPFLWDEGELIDLYVHSVGGNPLTANAINDKADIVGGGAFPNRVFDAYLWRNGVATDLGTLAGDCYSEAWAINSNGQVVGISFSCDFSRQRAFLWENGSMVDLDTLIPAHSSLQLQWPMAINDRGEVAGTGGTPGVSPPDNVTAGHAFVLIPCDATHSNGAGCKGGDVAAPINQSAAISSGLTSREVAAKVQARLGRRHQIPSLAARPTP